MNYLVQRGKVRGQVINVPNGLPEILSDITREVLRCQPTTECLCQFIIDYLHSVIVTREKSRVAKMIIDRALNKVNEIIEDLCICNISQNKAEIMSLVMEDCFKRFLEKRRCEHRQEKEIVKFNEEDMLDELIRRCKFSDDELKITKPMIEEAYNRFVQAYMSAQEGTEGTEALYNYFKEREIRREEEFQQNMAAIKIQANFRGFMVRRSLFVGHKDTVTDNICGLVNKYIAEPSPDELDEAARKIQKFFRQKHSMMHHIDEVPEPEPQPEPIPGEICEPVSNIGQEEVAEGAPAVQEEEVVIEATKLGVSTTDVKKPVAFDDNVKVEETPVEAQAEAPAAPAESTQEHTEAAVEPEAAPEPVAESQAEPEAAAPAAAEEQAAEAPAEAPA